MATVSRLGGTTLVGNMTNARAGWYPMPDGWLRYWDGTQWTQHRTAPVVATQRPLPSRLNSVTAKPRSVSMAPPSKLRSSFSNRLASWSTPALIAGALVVGIPASMATAAVGVGVGTLMLPTSETATVTKIVDGDTLDVQLESGTTRVRLLNVDAPESVKPGTPVQCLSLEASKALADLLPIGSTVTLGYDVSRKDQYGRTLAGVTNADSILVNAELARLGLGLPVVVGNNDKYFPQVERAAQEAQTSQVGLFSPTTECSVAAEADKVASAVEALESTPEPQTTLEAESLVTEAAAVAVLAASLESRLTSRNFEVVNLPKAVLKTYRAVASSATTRSEVVRMSAQDRAATIIRLAQEKQAEADAAAAAVVAAAQQKVEAEAKAKTDAAAKARAEAEAKAKAEAQRRALVAAAPPKKSTPTTTKPRTTTTAPTTTTGTSTSGCLIKGNISSSGEKIYHVPGGGSYSVTKITLSKGERWFCSEAAAVAAGWRAARN